VNNVETALVIILSIGFLTLLILSIIVVSLLLGVLRNVRRISQRAEEVTANAADITSMISKKVAPVAASAVMAAIVRKFAKSKKDE
jgi:hypothetical protein